MQSIVILISMLIARQCLAGGITETARQHEYSYLAEATVEVLKSCYASQVTTVGFAGNSDQFMIKALHSSISIPVTLLDSTGRVVGRDPNIQRERPYKLQVTVVTTSSSTELGKIFAAMKDSLWWNHMASILIIAWLPAAQDGCSKAFEMLSFAWKIDLLNAKLICFSPANERLVYTYNPYTRMAPDRWQVESIYRGGNGHPWTLLVRRYQDAEEICEELDYEKAHDLGGYEIRSTVMNHPGYLTVDLNRNGPDCFSDNDGLLSKILFRTLNANPKLLVYNQTSALGYTDNDGRDVLMDVVEGVSDIHLNHRYVIVKQGINLAYPHCYSGLGVITQYRGQVSQLKKILSVVDSSSRRGICLVTLINTLVFIFVLRQRPVSAILNTLRLVCNAGIPTVPTYLAPRFYLGALFLFVLTIQAIYQGRLAALLTKPVLLPNVNVMQDLVDGGYTVYAYKTVAHFFRPPIFEGRFVTTKSLSCIEHVLRDPKAACATEYLWLITESATLRLHLSKDIIIKLPVSYVIRDNWPLEARVNKVVTAMFEANIIQYVLMKPFHKLMNIRKSYEKHKEDEQFDAITLDEVTFAFVILGIGLCCAAVCFIVEVLTEQFRTKMSSS